MKKLVTAVIFALSTLASPLLSQQYPTVDLIERMAREQALQEVYWRHRIWPKENPGTKPPLGAVLSTKQLQAKAEDALRLTNALEMFWHMSIDGEQLQAELLFERRLLPDPQHRVVMCNRSALRDRE